MATVWTHIDSAESLWGKNLPSVQWKWNKPFRREAERVTGTQKVIFLWFVGLLRLLVRKYSPTGLEKVILMFVIKPVWMCACIIKKKHIFIRPFLHYWHSKHIRIRIGCKYPTLTEENNVWLEIKDAKDKKKRPNRYAAYVSLLQD